jgi:hypothetical protein
MTATTARFKRMQPRAACLRWRLRGRVVRAAAAHRVRLGRYGLRRICIAPGRVHLSHFKGPRPAVTTLVLACHVCKVQHMHAHRL